MMYIAYVTHRGAMIVTDKDEVDVAMKVEDYPFLHYFFVELNTGV